MENNNKVKPLPSRVPPPKVPANKTQTNATKQVQTQPNLAKPSMMKPNNAVSEGKRLVEQQLFDQNEISPVLETQEILSNDEGKPKAIAKEPELTLNKSKTSEEKNVNKDIDSQKIVSIAQKSKKDKKSAVTGRKRGKFLLILSLVLVFAASAAAAAYFMIDAANNTKLATPTLNVVQWENGTAVEASEIVGATKYEFEITQQGGTKVTVPSLTNACEFSSLLNQPGKFFVRVRVYGKGPRATSDYSESVELINYVKLSSPKISVAGLDYDDEKGVYKTNNDLTDDKLMWSNVAYTPGAVAEKYIVRWGENKTKEINSGASEINWDLSEIYKDGAGAYQITIVAVPSTNSYYLTSNYSEVIKIEYYDKQTPVSNVKYNAETKDFSFDLPLESNYGNKFNLNISHNNGQISDYELLLDECLVTKDDVKLTVVANIAHVVKGFVDRISVVTMGDGIYSENSEPVTVSFQ